MTQYGQICSLSLPEAYHFLGETIHMYKNIETRKTKEESSAVPQSYSEKYKEKAYHLICRRLVRGKKKKKIETIRVIVIASMS